MPTKLNPDTGLFEDTDEQPLTTIPDPVKPNSTVDPATDNINATDETVLEQEPPVANPTHVSSHHTHNMTDRQKLYLQITDIIRDHGGLESNVPVNHVYWQLLNQYRNTR